MTTHEEQTTDSTAEPRSRSTEHGGRGARAENPPPMTQTAADANRTRLPMPSRRSRRARDTSRQPQEMLFAGDDLADLRARWAGVQAAFVDDPKECVQKADVLVSDLVEQLTTGFAQARSRLEEQWSRGQEASTEDLRLALMHYREFFERLLAV